MLTANTFPPSSIRVVIIRDPSLITKETAMTEPTSTIIFPDTRHTFKK